MAPELQWEAKPKVRIITNMSRITLLMTTWAAVAGMTAYAEPSDVETPLNGTISSAATVTMEAPSDPFAVALVILNGEASAPTDAGFEIRPPSVDCLHPEEHSSVPSAQLAEGKVSSFRIGEEGGDQITISESGGLWVGVTAVDSHVIEIAQNGTIKAGTYTLIDYEGSIGGAGFSGLSLRGNPDLHAKLVNNTAETKIELVVSESKTPESPETARNIGNRIGSSLRSLLAQASAYLRGDETASSTAQDSNRNALQ